MNFWSGLVVGAVGAWLLVWLVDRFIRRYWLGRKSLLHEALRHDPPPPTDPGPYIT